MKRGGGVARLRSLRAPQHSGEALIDPPLSSAGALAEENAARLADFDYDCQGMAWRQLAQDARRQLIERAERYSGQYLDLSRAPAEPTARVLITGHQPELYHAGVWFKNFALSELGRRLGAHAIHLIIDNDTADIDSVRIPRKADGAVWVETQPLDGPADVVPYEERRIVDPSRFASFGERVRRAIEPLCPEPLISQLWPHAMSVWRRGASLGHCVAQARHRLESQYGLATLELPLSAACDTDSFRWFAAHILAQLPDFQEVYNTCLDEYRREYKVRSRSHPTPALETDGSWREAPFWLWRRDDPRRRRLFLRRQRGELEVTDRQGVRFRLELTQQGGAARAVEQLRDAARQGVKLRPRALVTTMYARLALSDLFLHGIGGAKYDRLTDAIIARFFGCEPPAFLTLTATFRLPVPHQRVEEGRMGRVARLLRELRYQPERHVPPSQERDRLADDKRRWIETLPPRGQRRRRHLEIERINRALRPLADAQRDALLAERRRIAQALRDNAILASREYSFCLFPQETLPARLLELLAREP